ncbi:neuroparsin-A-like [Coccinella septempunctata]|uniref:neuroparsin-A-like n=1 Tax=Coccinella septempunctata TaxID=41139 RepID=UPI001D095EEF|nr:neuroparsin-A-like [Coccinella septempunctata]XP_044745621.1 neuroparsin-A-like [Coccinella septempunctata]XP_044745622.1 neuroparsin-A-like [Coccinella septempunctata]
MRYFSSLLLIITIVILSDYVQWSAACRWCQGEECNVAPPTACPFGEYINRCRRRACLKGPGEKCGGPTRNSFGDCATGLYCASEGRCYGCFLGNLDCYPPQPERKITQY